MHNSAGAGDKMSSMESGNAAAVQRIETQFAAFELEFAKLQLQQSIDTYRTQMTLLVQVCTVLVIANCTIVGFALTNKLPAVLIVSAIFPLLLGYVIETVGRLSVPILYTALNVEDRYGVSGFDGLASTFLAFTSSVDYIRELRGIASTGGDDGFRKRISQLRTMPRPRYGGRRGVVRRFLELAMLVQVLAGIVLHYGAGWPIFGAR
jgi:hypothetical protein